MSGQALGWAIKVNPGGVGGKAVLLVLANYADKGGSCFPSVKRIARESCQTERTVYRWLDKMAKAGIIEWVKERRRDGTFKTRRYRLKLDVSPAKINTGPRAEPGRADPGADTRYGGPHDNVSGGEPPDTGAAATCHPCQVDTLESNHQRESPLYPPGLPGGDEIPEQNMGSDASGDASSQDAEPTDRESARQAERVASTRRFDELVRDWPGSTGEDQIKLRKLWDALTASDQREAFDNAVRYRASVSGRSKRQRILLWKYLHEKRWQALPAPRPRREPDEKRAPLPVDAVMRFLAADPDMALAACEEDWVLALVQFIAGHHRRPDSGEAAGLRASGRRSMEEWRRLAAAASGVEKRGAETVVAKAGRWRAKIEAECRTEGSEGHDGEGDREGCA